MDCKVELFTVDLERIYFAAETLHEFDSYPFKIREINFTFTGPFGGLVLHIEGTTHVRHI